MKIDKLKQRLQKDRPTLSVTINVPDDVGDDLAKEDTVIVGNNISPNTQI